MRGGEEERGEESGGGRGERGGEWWRKMRRRVCGAGGEEIQEMRDRKGESGEKRKEGRGELVQYRIEFYA